MPSNNFETLLKEDKELTYISNGYSMYPLIKQREDILHIVLLERKPLLGDILLYKDINEHYILHRLIKIKKDGTYLLAGDNNYWVDKPIREENILGILKDITKKDGKIINLEKDYKFKGFLKVHFHHLKSLRLYIRHIFRKIFRKRK